MALVVAEARGSEVAACCGGAAAQGVRPGMPLAEASALSRDLQIAVYEPPADRRALVKLAEACERFSPRVAVEEGDEPESLLLDISNLEHLYGSEAKLAGEVEKFFTRRGYRVRLAVAETVGAAWAAAHFGCERAGSSSTPLEDCKLQIADSLETNLQFSISSMPVRALRIAEETVAVLHELGIETIDQLLALPREGLSSRFGEELLRRLDQLTGRGRELIEPQRGLPALEASYALEGSTADRGVLVHVLSRLAEQLARQLAARDQGAVVLVCRLRCTGGREVPLRIGLLQPSASGRQLLELVELHLETVRFAGEVERVELRAVVVGRLGERQRELFADRWSSDPHRLAILVNRLGSRLGQERVLRVELRKSPVPERAAKFVPVTQPRVKKLPNAKCQMQIANWKHSAINDQFLIFNLPSPRPLTLYPEPQAMEVVCVVPDGPPQFVWVGKHRERIVNCVGPERIETLWWRGPSVRRDYYRVVTQSGGHLWMFRRLADGKWFVHGEFA